MDKLSDISVDLKLKHLQSRDLLFSVLNVKTVIPQNFIYEIIPPAADQRSLHLIPMYVGTLCRINICSEQSSKIWNDKTYVTRFSIFFLFLTTFYLSSTSKPLHFSLEPSLFHSPIMLYIYTQI